MEKTANNQGNIFWALKDLARMKAQIEKTQEYLNGNDADIERARKFLADEARLMLESLAKLAAN